MFWTQLLPLKYTQVENNGFSIAVNILNRAQTHLVMFTSDTYKAVNGVLRLSVTFMAASCFILVHFHAAAVDI